MALFNYATKEITLKIVYYGPGLSGKTTNLQHLHAILTPETKGKLLSLSTESDRTLFFDFLPVELGKIRDFSIRFQLYTVPGQVRYNATRKVVLKGADAVVFVADSQEDMRDQNIESFENMRENLVSNNINPDTIPVILQYNKRDLNNILSIDALNQDINQDGAHEVLEAVATEGKGVEETFKKITRLLLKDISRKHKIEIQTPEGKKDAAAPVKPISKPQPVHVKQDIFPEQKSYEIEIPEPVTSTARFEMPNRASAMEDVEVVPEFEINEAELIPEAEPVTVEAVEMTSDATAAVQELLEEGFVPEYEIDEAELIAETEPVKSAARPEFMFGSGANESESIAEVIAPPTELLFEESPPSVFTAPEAQLIEEALRTEVPPFPAEKFDALSEDIETLSVRLSKITDAIVLLQRTVSDLRGDIAAVKNDIAIVKETEPKDPNLKDLKEFKDLRRDQKEISDLLKDVLDLLSSLKEKKSWFRL